MTQTEQPNIQQEFFNYFFREHDLTTLYSDFSEVQAMFKKEYLPLVESAFVAGRSKTSWEQFKQDNQL